MKDKILSSREISNTAVDRLTTNGWLQQIAYQLAVANEIKLEEMAANYNMPKERITW